MVTLTCCPWLIGISGCDAWFCIWVRRSLGALPPTLEVLAVALSGELLPYLRFLLEGLAVTNPDDLFAVIVIAVPGPRPITSGKNYCCY